MPDLPAPPAGAPRAWHKWYARNHGYFWLPCPLCGEYFGGHEWMTDSEMVASIPDPASGPNISTGICPTCTKAGRGVPLTWGGSGD